MNNQDELLGLPGDHRKRPHRDNGRPPRKRFPSDAVDHRRLQRPDARPQVRIPSDRWEEWEALRMTLGGGDTTHASVIRWLLDSTQEVVRDLRRQANEAASILQEAAEQFIEADEGPPTAVSYEDIMGHMETQDDMHDRLSDDSTTELDSEVHNEEFFGDFDQEEARALGEDLEVSHHAQSSSAPIEPLEPDVVPCSQEPHSPVMPSTSTTTDPSIGTASSRSLPRAPATIAFFDRALIPEFVKFLKPRCKFHWCTLTPRVERIREHQQVWSIRVGCGRYGHSWPFVTGVAEPGRTSPMITPKLYHSTLCAGLTYTSLEALTSHLGLHVPSPRHWHKFQTGNDRPKMGWIAAAKAQWEENKRAIWEEKKAQLQARRLAGEEDPGLIVYLDTRWDSSRDGYHGTTSIIDIADSRVIEMITINKRQEDNSWLMEDKGAKAALENLRDGGVTITEVIHDDKKSVDTIIDDMGYVNQKDMWHKSKNFNKKFVERMVGAKTNLSCNIDEATSRAELRLTTVKNLQDWCRVNGVTPFSNLRKDALVEKVAIARNIHGPEPVEDYRRSSLKYPELSEHNIATKLKTWFYVCCRNCHNRGGDSASLAKELANCADHWAGDHRVCMTLSERPCQHLGEEGVPPSEVYYPLGGATHKAMKAFCTKVFSAEKMKWYTMARENFMSETFHSVMGKYAMKRIHFRTSHEARLCCCVMDWNENIRREVWRVYDRTPVNTAVRERPPRTRVLVERTTIWKDKMSERIYGVAQPEAEVVSPS